MVALSFSVFKDKLVSREKMHTIRPLNLTRLEQMERLGIQIYWKQRVKSESQKLYDATFAGVKFYAFDRNGLQWEVIPLPNMYDPNAFIDPDLYELSDTEKDKLSRKDGFNNIDELNQKFFEMYGKKLFEPDLLGLLPVFMGIAWKEESKT